MEWTERLEIRARSPQRKIRADDLHNIVGGGDLLDGICWDGAHGLIFRSFGGVGDAKFTQRNEV